MAGKGIGIIGAHAADRIRVAQLSFIVMMGMMFFFFKMLVFCLRHLTHLSFFNLHYISISVNLSQYGRLLGVQIKQFPEVEVSTFSGFPKKTGHRVDLLKSGPSPLKRFDRRPEFGKRKGVKQTRLDKAQQDEERPYQ
jgi:hypothetical protein